MLKTVNNYQKAEINEQPLYIGHVLSKKTLPFHRLIVSVSSLLASSLLQCPKNIPSTIEKKELALTLIQTRQVSLKPFLYGCLATLQQLTLVDGVPISASTLRQKPLFIVTPFTASPFIDTNSYLKSLFVLLATDTLARRSNSGFCTGQQAAKIFLLFLIP